MSGLERKAHRLVDLARSSSDPSAAQLLSLHGAVSARIAAEAAAASVGTAAGWKAAGASGVVKGLLAAGALATGVAGYWALPEQSPPAPSAVAHRAPPPPAPLAPVAEAAPPPSSVPAPPAARPSKPPTLRLQDEAALLADVQVSLRGGRPGEALAKLDSYDRRFASGMLRAEADAARVFALCAAGRIDKARAAAERFVQQYPNAPATARVQAACN
ncbi:MAG TPA: hypothetical protein VIW29_06125 [Polyangiaceae bacterium]